MARLRVVQQARAQQAGLAHRAPCPPSAPPPPRPHAKLYHLSLHTLALACTVLGVVAAFNSHSMKKPAPMANL